MKECCLADNEKVVVGGVRFFLGGDKEREELEESSDEEEIDVGAMKHQMGVNKKSKKRAKIMENAIAKVKRKEKRKHQPHPLNFSAFHLLHDPQAFAEAVFSKHLQNTARSRLNLEQKLLVLQLVTRLVGLHKLTIMNLYSYFIKYLTPRQPSVTSFLASLAQASHNLVPPDALEPLVLKIANEFVSEASASEVASAGLNAIREICVRQPLAMNETLLQDLVMYRKSKDKGVVMAARGLMALYREVGAELLKKKDRGKEAALGLRSGEQKEKRFGEEAPGEIEGLDLLAKWKGEEQARKKAERVNNANEGVVDEESEEDNDDGWEIDDDASVSSGGWMNVESDESIVVSDSDEEKPRKKQRVDKEALERRDNPEDEKKENSVEPSKTQEHAINLATTKILTPADFAKLQELRLEASLNRALPASQRKRLAQQAALQNRHADDPLTAAEIEGLAALSKKITKEEKIAMAREGKAERGEHKSTQAIRRSKKEASGKSSTNKEKARNKNPMMTLRKAKGKQKMSLVERSKILRAHKEREKRGGKRGNR